MLETPETPAVAAFRQQRGFFAPVVYPLRGNYGVISGCGRYTIPARESSPLTGVSFRHPEFFAFLELQLKPTPEVTMSTHPLAFVPAPDVIHQEILNFSGLLTFDVNRLWFVSKCIEYPVSCYLHVRLSA